MGGGAGGDARLAGRIGLATLGAAALVALYDALTLRSLFGDGFLYLVRVLEREAYWLEAPARRTVEWIRQFPLRAADTLGVGGLDTLAVLFGASIELLPIALTALCWAALPRERKVFVVFPLLTFCAGTLGATFAPITEGATAAAYFWLLFLLLSFRALRGVALVAIVALALGTRLLHEGMVLLAPILTAAAVWRARRTETPLARAAFWLLAAWFVYVVVLQIDYIRDPSHPGNRAKYLEALVSLWWLFGHWGSLNWPALFGIAGLLLVGVFAFMQVPQPRLQWLAAPLIALLGAAGAYALAQAFAADAIYAAQAQMNARNHPILISVPLALAALIFVAKPALVREALFRQSLWVCTVLAALSLAWHVEATRRWEDYVGIFRRVVGEGTGVLGWEETLAKLPPGEARLMEGMSHFWIEPSMSLVLAPRGEVRAILAARRAAGWYPFDARKPSDLPRSRHWTVEPFLTTLAPREAK